MPRERILILAGTSEARDLANALLAQGRDVVSSFAGVTRHPELPGGEIRVGGFGGTDGLAAFLEAECITCLVDATHPFALQMSTHAHSAANRVGLPLLRLERPPWKQQAGDRWISVATMAEAARHIPAHARVLVTTGRKSLPQFFARKDLAGTIRTIEPPEHALPSGWALLQDRPPYTTKSERALMTQQDISILVTKNAGGSATAAKLTAARELRIAVVMITRPQKPACPTVETVEQALLGIPRPAG
jgi:precorrin-6A/cobalt-precorrin-6A reductase